MMACESNTAGNVLHKCTPLHTDENVYSADASHLLYVLLSASSPHVFHNLKQHYVQPLQDANYNIMIWWFSKRLQSFAGQLVETPGSQLVLIEKLLSNMSEF